MDAIEIAVAQAVREASSFHTFTRSSVQGFGGTTTVTCACGWTNVTGSPQYHERAITSHRNACKKEAARLARKVARDAARKAAARKAGK